MSSDCEGSNSSPCLKLNMRDHQRMDAKMLSPESSRKPFCRKPESSRNNEMFRTRRNAEEAREFASFYSPTNSHIRQRSKEDTSIILEKSSVNTSQIVAFTERTMRQAGQIKYQASVCSTLHYQKPRHSAYYNQSQIHGSAAPNKNEEALTKKIKILEIQLEAITLQNARLKEHINLLRSNNQQLKTKLTENSTGSTRFSRKVLIEQSTNKEQSHEVVRLKQIITDLQKSLTTSTQQLQQQRQKLLDAHTDFQQKQRRLRQSMIQLQSIITSNKRENSLLKSTNQQLSVRLWNCHRQITQLQATERERKNVTMNLLKKQRIANHSLVKRLDKFQYSEREDELFELSPEHSS